MNLRTLRHMGLTLRSLKPAIKLPLDRLEKALRERISATVLSPEGIHLGLIFTVHSIMQQWVPCAQRSNGNFVRLEVATQVLAVELSKLRTVIVFLQKGTKGTVFFFPEKVHGPFIHSNRKIVFFFPRSGKKKYKGVFFFSQKKFMRHSFRIWWVFLYFF